jgi:hypothetical protein
MKKRIAVLSIILVVILIIAGISFILLQKRTLYDLGIISNAKYKNDSSLCYQIKDDLEYQNLCLAIVKADVDACKSLQSSEYRDRCFFGMPLAINACGNIENSNQEGECYTNYALYTQNASVCNIISDFKGLLREQTEPYPAYWRDNCYLGVRLRTNDTSLCDKIQGESNKNYCISPPADTSLTKLS